MVPSHRRQNRRVSERREQWIIQNAAESSKDEAENKCFANLQHLTHGPLTKKMGRAQVEVHGNKASLSLTYSGVHDISVKRVYFCIRRMPRNRLFFFFILENSESRNLDGFLFLEFLWGFYQTSKFYQHIDLEKMFLTLSQNFAKVHRVYSSCSRVSITPISLSPGRTSSRGS